VSRGVGQERVRYTRPARPVEVADRDRDELEPAAGTLGEAVGLAEERTDDLATHGARTEDRDAERRRHAGGRFGIERNGIDSTAPSVGYTPPP
jgi:hypothetical protein